MFWISAGAGPGKGRVGWGLVLKDAELGLVGNKKGVPGGGRVYMESSTYWVPLVLSHTVSFF